MKKALFALSAALIAAASAAPEALAAKTRTEPVGVYAVVTDGTGITPAARKAGNS